MIDEPGARAAARFAPNNSTAENLHFLRIYLEQFGRPARFCTHRLSLFRGNPRWPAGGAEGEEAGWSQIRRALAELEIEWSPSGWAKTGLAARFFRLAERELAPGLQQAGIETLADANRYLERVYLPWWRSRHGPTAAPGNAHRPLLAHHDLDSILSEVETRVISARGTVQFRGETYRLPQRAYVACGASAQIERRPDGETYLRAGGRCVPLEKAPPQKPPAADKPRRPAQKRRGGANRAWMRNFFKTPAPPLWRLLK
ncbi:MAG TPA: hypothetical protein VKV74_05545 [Bryobacteraceae bacterium]|nr:hypothetical protein [Bryobacteraceae bacterium]